MLWRSPCRGFSLIEVAIVVMIVAILAVLLAPLLGGLADAEHSIDAYNSQGLVYRAIVGDPSAGNYGYLGDVGDYPLSLADLVLDRGLPGWNGPYLTDVYTEGGVLYDAFGAPLEYYYVPNAGAVTDQLAIVSKGPDRGSSNLSLTPNTWMTYTGLPLPGSAGYVSYADNLDNVDYPRFTDHRGLLSYNNIGQLNLNIFNFDSNGSRYVPGCPNMFDIKVTSLTRPLDTWGLGDDTTPTYSPGGATFDLIQGTYRVQIRMRASPHGIVYDDTVAIAPGASQTKTVNLPGPNSSVTPTYTLNIVNDFSFDVEIFDYTGASLGAAAAGGGGYSGSVKSCSQVGVRNLVSGTLVDSFLMPVLPTGVTTYNKIYDPLSYNYTVTNNSGAYRYLFVYLNNLLVGEVSGWGNKKVKVFGGLKPGDEILIKDQTGSSRDGIISIFSDDAATF